MSISQALLLNGKSFHDRELRVTRYLKNAEAIEKQKLKDAARNGRKKMKKVGVKPEKKVEKKVGKKEKAEKKEKVEKKEKAEKKVEKKVVSKSQEKKRERKPREERKEKIDLSFMGKRASLSMNAVNAKKRILKKQKK